MAKLGEIRRSMRIDSLTTAATIIENYHTGGAGPEELGITEKEYKVLLEENERTAKILMAMAEKLRKPGDDE